MGVSHNPSVLFLTPEIIVSLSLVTVTVCLLNCTMQLSSHSLPTESKEALCRSGKTCAVAPLGDNVGMGSVPVAEAEIVELSGRITLGVEEG